MSVSYFVNGVGAGYASRGTKGLVGSIRDSDGSFVLGQSRDGECKRLLGTERWSRLQSHAVCQPLMVSVIDCFVQRDGLGYRAMLFVNL